MAVEDLREAVDVPRRHDLEVAALDDLAAVGKPGRAEHGPPFRRHLGQLEQRSAQVAVGSQQLAEQRARSAVHDLPDGVPVKELLERGFGKGVVERESDGSGERTTRRVDRLRGPPPVPWTRRR